jgi:hypothetical protein
MNRKGKSVEADGRSLIQKKIHREDVGSIGPAIHLAKDVKRRFEERERMGMKLPTIGGGLNRHYVAVKSLKAGHQLTRSIAHLAVSGIWQVAVGARATAVVLPEQRDLLPRMRSHLIQTHWMTSSVRRHHPWHGLEVAERSQDHPVLTGDLRTDMIRASMSSLTIRRMTGTTLWRLIGIGKNGARIKNRE